MNTSGNIVEEYNYDAWGRRRNPADWSYCNVATPTYTQHGFTGHEHLDMFNLINMNGRVYDSEIARFLSPDPIIQDPHNLLSYNRYSYCLNNPLKYIDPSGYNRERILRDMEENEKNDPGGSVFYNNYPAVWSAYTSSVTSGYTGGYGNFVTQYYDALTSSQTSASNNGTNGFYVTWETNYTYTNGTRQEVRDKDGNLVGIILPEVGIGVERHSVFVPNPGEPNYINRLGVLDGVGFVADLSSASAALTAKLTYKYGTRTMSAVELTAQGAKTFGKLATRFNVAGAGIGAIDCTVQGVSDYKNGNTGLATFEFSKAAAYTAGIILVAISPFTAGSTAAVGVYIIAGTSAADVAGDIGLYIYGRNK